MKNPMLAIGLAAAMALSVSALQAQSTDKDSQTFIRAAIQGNFAEIDNGKLAQRKATSPEVKAFGDMLVTDHTRRQREGNAGGQATWRNAADRFRYEAEGRIPEAEGALGRGLRS